MAMNYVPEARRQLSCRAMSESWQSSKAWDGWTEERRRRRGRGEGGLNEARLADTIGEKAAYR